jgi:endoglucanase
VVALATTGLVIALTSTPAMAAGTGSGYLSTSGSKIVDSGGATVKITGINWFGMETDNKTFHGLWASVTWKDQLNHMAELGYNTIRIPYSNDALKSGAAATGVNDFTNPDLVGKSPLEILDLVIEHAGSLGMRIILDRHRPDAGSQSKLWYRGEPSDSARTSGEATWISDWKMLAQRYAGNTTVIGADLHNEPHAEGTSPQGTGACWGCGDINRDWRLAAERAGNAILSVNPNWLIFVEGVSCPSGGTSNVWDGDTTNDERCGWWGGNLSQAKQYPVRLDKPNKLVYSPHEYGVSVFEQDWFKSADFPNTLNDHWDYMFGYLAKENIAPIMMGEFGSTLADPRDKTWLTNLMSYLSKNGMSFTYWSWNPNSGDTGGIVQDDWTTVNQAKQSIIQPYLVAPVATGGSGGSIDLVMPSASVPVTQPRPSTSVGTSVGTSPAASPATSGGCTASYTTANTWASGYQGEITVRNTGTAPLGGWKVVLTLPDGMNVGQTWGGLTSTTGASTVTISNLDWNRSLAGGTSTVVGFTGTGGGSPTVSCVAA